MEALNLEELTKGMFPSFSLDGERIVDAVLQGDVNAMLRIVLDEMIDALQAPLVNTKELFVYMLLLGIAATLCKQFGLLVMHEGVQKLSFWMVYILLAKALLEMFYLGQNVVIDTLTLIVKFGEIFIPTFSIVLTAAAGSITSAGYIATMMFIIYMIQNALLLMVLPCIEGYVLLVTLGGIWEKDRIEKLLETIEKGFGFIFKMILMIVSSIGILQSMLLPFIDSMKVGVAKNILSVIPGVGTVADSTIELVTGSAILLKNGIGVVGIIILIILIAVPFVQLGFLCITMKFVTIVFGFLGEKQMCWCADKISYAHGYLCKMVGVSVLLCLLWIAIAVYTTNQRLLF